MDGNHYDGAGCKAVAKPADLETESLVVDERAPGVLEGRPSGLRERFVSYLRIPQRSDVSDSSDARKTIWRRIPTAVSVSLLAGAIYFGAGRVADEVSRFNDNVDQTQEQLNEVDVNSKFSDLQARFDELIVRLDRANEEWSESNDELGNTNDQLQGVKEEMDELNQELADLKRQFSLLLIAASAGR